MTPRTCGVIFAIIFSAICFAFVMSREIIPFGKSDPSYDLNPNARFARNHLRQILEAISVYHSDTGVLPYHPEGSDSALYLLRNYLPATCFANTPTTNSVDAPYWDDERKELKNSGWEYLNQRGNFQSQRIYIVSHPIPHSSIVYLGLKHGEILTRELARHPGCKLLGSFVTSEGFIVASEDLSTSWSRMAPSARAEASIFESGQLTEITDTHRGLIYRYEYIPKRDALARRCIFSVKSRVEIKEDVQVDDVKQIIGIGRTPENWRDVWNRMVNSQGLKNKSDPVRKTREGMAD
ncbi:MAG: hypothetical protein V4719_10945 [Planctomycetota bacterium]